MRFRYLIWDFDGTLFDTYPALIKALERGLADFNLVVPREDIAALLSQTLDICIHTLITTHGLDLDAFEERVSFHHRQTALDDQPLFPGVVRVCERFVAAGGMNTIFTHRAHQSLRRFLDHHGITPLFADTLSVDAGYPRKPDPAGFITLIERHHMPRAEVLVIGDRDLDIQAGQEAGVQTCMFQGVPSPGVCPDYRITTYPELEAILD
jgi:phosphoglycolate phosphatase-like HAD superfamily hydrolase